MAAGPGTLVVSNSAGTSSTFPITLGPVAPGLFTVDAAGTMPAAQVVTGGSNNTQTIQLLATCSGTPLICTSPPIPLNARTQVYLVLYGTGIRGPSKSTNVSVTIGGVVASPAYAGAQVGFPGLDQVNVQVPSSLAGRGQVDLKVTADGVDSNTVKVVFK